MLKSKKILSYLSLLTTIIALITIGLGAYTRLKDAGLGCPDWPGCYGHLLIPTKSMELTQAQQNFPKNHFVSYKAWAEMIHRYFAGPLLGLLVFATAIVATLVATQYGLRFLILAISLLCLLIYQALLGMWTVTLKLLPIVVTQHLLGGMLIFGISWLTWLNARDHRITNISSKSNNPTPVSTLIPWALIALILVFLQIFLGAWTSTHYAALSCPDFPYCKHQWQQVWDFTHAFQLLTPIGLNYEGGLLNNVARMTIHMVHRFGALILTFYLCLLSIRIFCMKTSLRLRQMAGLILMVLLIQLSLGTINVLFKLPIGVAIAHTLTAAILLISIITLNFILFTEPYDSNYQHL